MTEEITKKQGFLRRLTEMQISFIQIKRNPSDLNHLFSHVGLMSDVLEELILDYIEHLNEEEKKQNEAGAVN